MNDYVKQISSEKDKVAGFFLPYLPHDIWLIKNRTKKELIETNECMMNKRNELIQNNKVLQVGLDRYNAIATKRPDSCIDDGCAFIKDVISGRGNQVIIDSNLLQIEELHHMIEDCNTEIDLVTQMIDLIVTISDFMTKFKNFRELDTSFHVIPDYAGNIKKFITDIFKNQIELPPIIILVTIIVNVYSVNNII